MWQSPLVITSIAYSEISGDYDLMFLASSYTYKINTVSTLYMLITYIHRLDYASWFNKQQCLIVYFRYLYIL